MSEKATLVVSRDAIDQDANNEQVNPYFKAQVLPSSSLETGQPYSIAVWADLEWAEISRAGSFRPASSSSEREAQRLAFLARLEQINTQVADYAALHGVTPGEARRVLLAPATPAGYGLSIALFNLVGRDTNGGLTKRDKQEQALMAAVDALAEDRTEHFTLSGSNTINTSLPIEFILSSEAPPNAELLQFLEGETPDTRNLSDIVPVRINEDRSVTLYPELETAGSDGKTIPPKLVGTCEITYTPQAPDLFHSPRGESDPGVYSVIYQHVVRRDQFRIVSWRVTEAEPELQPVGSRKTLLIVRDFCDESLISGASVTVTGNGLSISGTTNLLGRLDLGVLPFGTYNVSISASGYQPNGSDALSNEQFLINATFS